MAQERTLDELKSVVRVNTGLIETGIASKDQETCRNAVEAASRALAEIKTRFGEGEEEPLWADFRGVYERYGEVFPPSRESGNPKPFGGNFVEGNSRVN